MSDIKVVGRTYSSYSTRTQVLKIEAVIPFRYWKINISYYHIRTTTAFGVHQKYQQKNRITIVDPPKAVFQKW